MPTPLPSLHTALESLLSHVTELHTLHISDRDGMNACVDTMYNMIASQHGAHLVRLAAHYMVLSAPALKEICTQCVRLEELVFGFRWGDREVCTEYKYALHYAHLLWLHVSEFSDLPFAWTRTAPCSCEFSRAKGCPRLPYLRLCTA